MPREGIFFQRRLHHPTQPCKSSPQIGYACGDPDARSCRQANHQTKHSITARSASTSTLPKMRSVPLQSFISIVPGRAVRSSSCQASTDSSFATFTGRKFAVVFSRPSRYSFRQWNNWLAFTSCRRATLDTEAPGTSVSSTIARRSAFVRHRFFLPGSSTWCECVSVSTIPLPWTRSSRSTHPYFSFTYSVYTRWDPDAYGLGEYLPNPKERQPGGSPGK